jgi:hypothetical protein
MNLWIFSPSQGSCCFIGCILFLGVAVLRVQAASSKRNSCRPPLMTTHLQLAFCRLPHPYDYQESSSIGTLFSHHHAIGVWRVRRCRSESLSLSRIGGGHRLVTKLSDADNNEPQEQVLRFPEEEEEEEGAGGATFIERKQFTTWKKLPLLDQHYEEDEEQQQSSLIRMILHPIFSIVTFAACSYCCIAVLAILYFTFASYGSHGLYLHPSM